MNGKTKVRPMKTTAHNSVQSNRRGVLEYFESTPSNRSTSSHWQIYGDADFDDMYFELDNDSYIEAVEYVDTYKWQDAMDWEMGAIRYLSTWKLDPQSSERNVIASKC